MAGLTHKQEQFAQLVANGVAQVEAYRRLYKSDVMSNEVMRVKAHEVATNGNVSVRIAEIQAELRENDEVTRESVVRELEEARVVSKSKEQGAAMVSASMGKAKLYGLLVDKVVVEDNFRDEMRKAAKDMNAKEAQELYARELNDLAS